MRFHIASRFFPYLGGKHFLVKKLVPLIPPHRVYVEVFGGAAALLFAKERSPVEVYNDLDSDLVNLFEVVRDRKEEFMKRLEWLPYSRELYERYLRELDERRIVDAVERAVAFCYCMKAAFAGKWRGGWAFARKGGNRAKVWSRLHIDIESIAERVKDLHIDHLDFRRCIKNWDSPDTFFFCAPGHMKIRLENETLSPICRVKVNDSTIDGKALAVLKRPYRGQTARLWVGGLLEPIEVTPDHPILAVTKREIWNVRQRKHGRPRENELRWIKAGELRKGDYVAVRCGGATLFNKRKVTISAKPRKQGRLIGYKTQIEWGRELFRFFGYYLAEGHVQYVKGRPYSLIFTFGSKEKAFHTEVAHLSKRLFGKPAIIRRGPHPSVTQVMIHARPVTEFVLRHCGSRAPTKKCSSEVMTSRPSLQLELLKAWLLGDGGFEASSRNRNRVRGSTTSYSLSHQLYQMTLRNRLVATHRRRVRNYDIVISNNLDLRTLGYKVKQRRATCVTRPIVGNHILAPIRRIELRNFIGTVWNLTTETHHMTTNYVETHNCDPPYIGTLQPRVTLTEQDHRDLAQILHSTQGKWLLTYNDHPLIHELYDGRDLIIEKIRCQMASRKWGQGPRRGALTNLVIRNYKLESSKVGK